MTVLGFQTYAVAGEDRASAEVVARALAANGSGSVTFEVLGADGRRRRVDVPPLMVEAIRRLADLLAGRGHATVVDEDVEVSPEKAAEILGMSRPTVVQRINQGQLRGRMVGTHHRIRISDLLAFRDNEADRTSSLEECGEQTDELIERHGL